jgi:hypothetical protein
MSEDFGVRIKVDPGAAIPTIKDFGSACASAEGRSLAAAASARAR